MYEEASEKICIIPASLRDARCDLPAGTSKSPVRFGVFELDPLAGELRKSGHLVKLQPHPIRVLVLLISRAGQLVTREEIREGLWGTETFVDFEQGLNSCIRQIRLALGDNAESPRYIETLPKRGYRFIAPTSGIDVSTAAVAQQPKSEVNAKSPFFRLGTGKLIAIVVLFVLLAGGTWFYVSRHLSARPLQNLKILPLTSLPGREQQPSFSPEGNQIAFSWNGQSPGQSGIYVKLIGSESLLRLTSSSDDCCPVWSPDGGHVAFARYSAKEYAIYIVPALGGPERKLYAEPLGPRFGDLDWSPNGKSIAFSSSPASQPSYSIFIIDADSLEKTQITNPSESYFDWGPAFSPDGKTLAFVRTTTAGGADDIYVVSLPNGNPRRLTFDNRQIGGPPAWTSDGQQLVFSSTRSGLASLWIISALGGTPTTLSALGVTANHPTVSRHGHRLAYEQVISNFNMWRAGLSHPGSQISSSERLTSSNETATAPQVSPDGKRLAFQSDRSGNWEIWAARDDGSNPVQLTSFNGPHTGTPRWSPDGQQIAFDSRPEGRSDIFTISAAGGPPRLLTTEPSDDVVPSWSRDGRAIYFASDRSGAWQVWKIPTDGGPAVQVTREGGFAAFESPDGKFVYYAKGRMLPGIWKVPVGGGEETPVLDSLRRGCWGNWAVVKEGIYFIDPETQPHAAINFFNFATRRVTQIGRLEKPPQIFTPGLAVSDDGRWVVYVQEDRDEADLVLAENFK